MHEPLFSVAVDTSEQAISNDEADAVRRGLIEFNRRHLHDDYKPLGIYAHDGAGRMIGGIVGTLCWGICSVDLLWVEEAWRGRGVGSALMAAAEETARAHGCRRIVLDTMSFQAPDFYRKLGFERFGFLTGYPGGVTRSYLVKDVAP